MNDIPAVKVLNPFDDLSEYLPSIVFRESSIRLGFKICVKRRRTYELQDKVQLKKEKERTKRKPKKD